MSDRFNPTTLDRQRTMLRTAMGPAIATALADPAVIEVMVNPDGRLWIDRHGDGRVDTGERLRRRRDRTDHPAGREPYWPGVPSRTAGGLGRIAGNRRALRGPPPAGVAGPVLRDPQAGARALPAHRLCRGGHHDATSGEGAGSSRGVGQEHCRGRRHELGQDDTCQCASGGSGGERRPGYPDRGHTRAPLRSRGLRQPADEARRRLARRPRPLDPSTQTRTGSSSARFAAPKPSTC